MFTKAKIMNIVVPSLLMLYGLNYYLQVRKLPHPETNNLFIRPIFFLLVLLFLVIMIQVLREKSDAKGFPIITQKGLVFISACVAYLLLINPLGLVISNLIFLPTMMYYLGVKKPIVLGSVPVALTALIVAVFQLWLKLPIPQGLLGFFG